MIADLIRAAVFLAGCLLLLAVLAYDGWCLLREAVEKWCRAGQWIEREFADLDAGRGREPDDPAPRADADGADATAAGTGEHR
ncbi:hypothetical protein [Actinomadura litoris]|uniref:hypothetical protein n=1 Tax=Actinomadura litoris TaxID=2678616 RepID=UPI001FA6BF25|nr:hypothetical protein [Actinomadura litoris]